MGRHPMGEGVDPNPRIMSERIVDPDALVMGKTAENLHDRYPTITKERVDAYAVRSQEKTAAAYDAGKIQPDLVPVATRSAEAGWGLAIDRRADAPAAPRMESLAGAEDAVPRRTARSPPATPPASTTAPPPRCSPTRRPPASSGCRSRCGWCPTPSSASSPR